MSIYTSSILQTKICSKCKIEKSHSEFYKNKITKDGFNYSCKICCYQRKKPSIDTFIGVVHSKLPHIKVVGWDGISRSKTAKSYDVYCSECAKDKALFGDGIFKQTKRDFINDKIPCGCSTKPLWSENQYKILIKRKCKETNYKFIEFAEKFHGSTTKLIFECPEHGIWNSSTISNFLYNNHGCPLCADHGFNQNKSAYLYINQSSDGVVKIGITNNDLCERLNSQSKTSGLKFETKYTFYHESGQFIRELEQKILNHLKTIYKQPDIKCDGYTEMFVDANLDYVYDLLSCSSLF